ncbi:MAG: hypothetical protein CMM02_14115 [Rhodopirellula sp.]|nr:hypothetical protein [Rhodopirellula sp.]
MKNNHNLVLRNSVRAAKAACVMIAEIARLANLPNLGQLKTVSTSTNGSSTPTLHVQVFVTDKFGNRVMQAQGLERYTRYVAYRSYENEPERSFEFTVTDDQKQILVDEDTIQPPPDTDGEHELIEPDEPAARRRLFPIQIRWANPQTCRFMYQGGLNVPGSGDNVFGPGTNFAVYKK